MRIAIVNDVPLAVEALRRIVAHAPGYEVAWIGKDGEEAVRRCAADVPDLILMDLMMPRMDGAEATRLIMRASPCAILIVTATIEGHSDKVFEAMGAGALDAVTTPALGHDSPGGQALLRKIAMIGKLIGPTRREPPRPAARETGAVEARPPLVAMAASTGGPKALARVLTLLPRALGATIVLVQHIDLEFAPTLASWLTQDSGRDVVVARPGDRPRVDLTYLAATADHLVLTSACEFDYRREPSDHPYRPSADVFFESVVEYWAGPAVGVVLTGMGSDGAQGLLAMRRRGWHTIAQDAGTSVVFGMPKAAAANGGAVEVRPLDAIAGAIEHAVRHAARPQNWSQA